MITLKKLYKLSFSNPHVLKCKNKKEISINYNGNISKIFQTSINNILSNPFSQRNRPIIDNNYLLLSNRKNKYLISSKKDNYIFNSYLSNSNKKMSKDKKSFTKIIPKITLNKNSLKEKKISLTNKILSIYTTPLKEFSSGFADTTVHKESGQISFSEIKNKNYHNNNRYNMTKNTKYTKMKFFNSAREKINDEFINEKKIDNKDKVNSYERAYYEKLRKNTKEFILEKKFNKKFRYELNKFKPWQYRTFYNK